MRRRQTAQKGAHDKHTGQCDIKQGDPVFVSNFGPGPKWLPVRSLQDAETVVEVTLEDGRQVRRHADHIRSRQIEQTPEENNPKQVSVHSEELQQPPPGPTVQNSSNSQSGLTSEDPFSQLQGKQSDVTPTVATHCNVCRRRTRETVPCTRNRHSPTFHADFVKC